MRLRDLSPDQAWVLENAATDVRSLANPLVAGDFGLRFYAGVPLTTTDGFNLGTLCVIDREPRPITEDQIRNFVIWLRWSWTRWSCGWRREKQLPNYPELWKRLGC